jgi:CBS domain containing-hemolysin-like protein
MTLAIVGSLFLVAANGFFVATEFAIARIRPTQIDELEAAGKPASPKSLAIARNTRTALAVAVPMRLFYVATKPLVDFFNWMGNMVLAPFGIPRASEVGHAPHSEDELRLLLEQSLREGLIDSDEREYAENVFSFGDRRARQVMVPRPEIDYVSTEDDVVTAARRATASGHTRLPLCEPEEGLDAPVGVVNAKDLLATVLGSGSPSVELRDLARPVKRVSDSILIDELLTELRRERQHLALVADEHGTTVGLVTLEAILEEIVGEIEDEFDAEAADLITSADDFAAVKGWAPIHFVAEKLGLEFDHADEATIGGHVLEVLGRMPEHGEVVEIDGRRVEVTAVDDARILELRFPLQETGEANIRPE